MALFLMFFYCFFQTEELERKIAGLEASLEESETQRISDAYEFQRKLEQLSGGVPEPEKTPSPDFASALRNGEIQSVLVIGDSISDGNGDNGCLYTMEERAEAGARLIGEIDGTAYYENAWDSQGWVTFFRNYLLENTSVTEFHNNAIGGKSAKWGNAHKEQWIPRDYDAIFVMLGTNDRSDCLNQQEFYTEYAQLLEYAESRCDYLTVLTPIPAITNTQDGKKNMDTREISDTVLTLCANRGYPVINCYQDLLRYALEHGVTLADYIPTGTHPCHIGYVAVYRLIMEELGLNPPIGDWFSEEGPAELLHIGMNRDDIQETTRLTDLDAQGDPIFPMDFSVYYTWNSFGEELPYGCTLITFRTENGGYQIARIGYFSYDLTRTTDSSGNWGAWSVIDESYRTLDQIR